MTKDSVFSQELTVTIAPDVTFRNIDEEIVLINLETERMFTLNSSGARFWQLLAEGQELGQISRQMQGEYEVGSNEIEKEISDLLGSLREEGLIAIG